MGRKRKISGLIPNQKVCVPPCRICKAPGTGFHYGVNTCEACKGFFHRSIGQHVHYRCRKDNSCTIHFQQYTFCRKCRFEKCLAFGMSKTAIKTGRYSSLKRTANILELKRLEKLHGSSQSFESDLENGSDKVSSSISQSNSPFQVDMYTPPDSTTASVGSPQTLSDPSDLKSQAWGSPPPLDIFALPSSKTSLSSSVNRLLASDDHCSPAESLPSLMLMASDGCPSLDNSILADTSSSFQLTPVASPLVSGKSDATATTTLIPFSPQSFDRNHQTFTSHLASSHLGPGDHSQCSFPFLQMQLSGNSIHKKDTPKLMSSSPQFLSSERSLPPLLIQNNKTPALSEDTDAKPEQSEKSKLFLVKEPSDKILENIAKLYADSKHVVRTLARLERQTLRLEARDLSPEEILSQQLKHKEECTMRLEIFGRRKLLQHCEYDRVRRETGLDVDNREQYLTQIFTNLERTIVSLCLFTKGIPGIEYIPIKQMVKLIKQSHWDVCTTSSLKLTNLDLMVTMSRSYGWVCPYDFDERSAATFVNDSIKAVGKVQKANLTDDEIAVMLAMSIVTPDRGEPSNSPYIRCIHSHLVEILLELLKESHEQPLKMFADIVAMLTELRLFETRGATNYLKSMQDNFKTVLCEKAFVQEILTGMWFQTK